MTVPGSVISWTNAHIHTRSRVFVFIHLEYQALNEVLVSKCNDLYYAAFVFCFFASQKYPRRVHSATMERHLYSHTMSNTSAHTYTQNRDLSLYHHWCSHSSSCRQATLIRLIKMLWHGDCLSATHPLRVLSSTL